MLLGGTDLSVDRSVNIIDRMVNTSTLPRSLGPLVAAYVVTAVGTLGVLGVLSATAPAQAGQDAWVHAVVVAVFAAVLWLRLRAARRGSRRAQIGMVVIASVLAVANVVEAALPDLFPTWMRWEMLAITVLMVAVLMLCAAPARQRR
jgi:hypothetical protein